ncbi:squalene synthetase-like protein [Polyrhizophydium stewartii]|uniref:Squalene synthetase-like protein n=1 Tax=Polyrhizophydium stewartii TaxID=2732419 RepID=A0ABR4N9P5_9FUNG
MLGRPTLSRSSAAEAAVASEAEELAAAVAAPGAGPATTAAAVEAAAAAAAASAASGKAGRQAPRGGSFGSRPRQHVPDTDSEELDELVRDYLLNADSDFVPRITQLASLSIADERLPHERMRRSASSAAADVSSGSESDTKGVAAAAARSGSNGDGDGDEPEMPEAGLYEALMHDEDEMAYDSDNAFHPLRYAGFVGGEGLPDSASDASDSSESNLGSSAVEGIDTDDSDGGSGGSESGSESDESSLALDMANMDNDAGFNERRESQWLREDFVGGPSKWTASSRRRKPKSAKSATEGDSGDSDDSDDGGGRAGLGFGGAWDSDDARDAKRRESEMRFQQILNGDFSDSRSVKQRRKDKGKQPASYESDERMLAKRSGRGQWTQGRAIRDSSDDSSDNPSDGSSSDSTDDSDDSDSDEANAASRGNWRVVTQQMASKSQRRKQNKANRREKRAQLRREADERQRQSDALHSALAKSHSMHITKDILTFLRQANKIIKKFVAIAHLPGAPESAILPPMPAAIRRLVCEIAKAYKVVPKTRGSGKKKITVVFCTGFSAVPDNWTSIPDQVAQRHNGALKGNTGRHQGGPANGGGGGKKGKGKAKDTGKGKKQGHGGGSRHRSGNDSAAVPEVGHVVGGHAKPIDASNVGHRMMLAMGWRPGQSLGTDGVGIVDPVAVTVRSKRGGLGGM